MALEYVGIFFVLFGGVIFKVVYNHRGKKYQRNKQKQDIGTSLFKYIYPYLQYSTPIFAIMSYLQGSKSGQLFFNPVIFFIGLSLTFFGIAGLIWAKKTLKENYSPCFDAYYPERIIESGPYFFVRHPIYSFNIVSLTGLFLSCGSIFVLINTLIMTFYYVSSAYREEKTLLNKYKDYQEYYLRTGRFFPLLRRFHGIPKEKISP